MSSTHDRDLGMHRGISRRDFVNGMAVAVGGSLIVPGWLSAQDDYPPSLTGMRGSHDGSFEVAHALRDGKTWPDAEDTGEHYDLVVVGGGLSGLSAAYFFLTSAGRGARVLVLDNHDDFGGHAKRNEMTYRGRTLMLNGGTSYLESVRQYSTVARTLLAAIGIDVEAALEKSAPGMAFYRSLGLGRATFFAKEVFGEDRLVKGRGGDQDTKWSDWVARTPLAPDARKDLARLYDDSANPDYMRGLADVDKKERLAKLSYRDFLSDFAKVHPHVIAFFDDRPKGSFCVGVDGYPALYAWAQGYPGFQGMNLEPLPRVGPLSHLGRWTTRSRERVEPWAGLVLSRRERDGGPASRAGDDSRCSSGEHARRFDHGAPRVRPHRPQGQDARIRLNSTAISVRHLGDPDAAREVEVTYVRGDKAEKVRADHCVMGCYNGVIPHLVPEMSDEQKAALMYGVKMPIVYTNVLIRTVGGIQEPRYSRCDHARDVPHRGAAGSLGPVRGLPALSITGRAHDPAHDARAVYAGASKKRAAPSRAYGSTHGDLRDVRAPHPRPTRSNAGRRRLRPRARHRSDHREPLAARLRLQLRYAERSDRVGALRS